MGEIPLPHQTAWMDHLHGLEYHPTAFRLDWMQEGEQDFADSSAFLTMLIQDLKPDLLHFNHLCYGSLAVEIPRLVVAHGDLVSWWNCVHGRDPKETRWLRWYRDAVTRGVAGADAVVAPTVWMLDTISAFYVRPGRGSVIYNGRNPIFFNPYVNKEDSVLAVGRMLDAGRQVSLLTQFPHPLPVCIVGSETPAESSPVPIRADVKIAVDEMRVSLKGPQTEAQMRSLYSRASIYAATPRYDPFGTTALEAAFSRCAIVANDIPCFRELWGNAALYFRTNDGASLAETIRQLGANRSLLRDYAGRAFQRARDCFTAHRMIEEYLSLYRELASARRAAA
jgi:glycosyltransferase involved in cell wall biosynthesis